MLSFFENKPLQQSRQFRKPNRGDEFVPKAW